VEACWNWGLIYDELEELEQVEEVVLAHPYKTRLIADAQIKADRLDLCTLDYFSTFTFRVDLFSPGPRLRNVRVSLPPSFGV
jgi:hypothetical protein